MAPLADPSVEEVTWETYGPLKAECDRIVQMELGDAATIVRPSYIVGPGDSTDRFTYWVDRIHRGGDVLTASAPDAVIQWVDVRDLCPWVVNLVERDQDGIYNAAGPSSEVTRAGLMWGIRATTDAPVRFWWPDEALLEELEIAPPMLDWNPRDDDRSVVFANAASMRAGLNYRSLADSVTGTLEWWNAQPAERRAEPRRWIPADKEREAIARLEGA